jgi:MFS family permease
MIDNKLIWHLFFLILFSFMSYLIPSTFLPSIAQQKQLSLSSIGFIICLFPIGAIFVSYHLGKHMEKIGKKRIIFYGGMLLAVSMLLFAATIKI